MNAAENYPQCLDCGATWNRGYYGDACPTCSSQQERVLVLRCVRKLRGLSRSALVDLHRVCEGSLTEGRSTVRQAAEIALDRLEQDAE